MSSRALMSYTAAPVAGWYGKIPALGDFASRRLSQEFVKAWDDWLQGALAASRSALGKRWQDFYLNSPIWRFALLPGVCDNNCWTGIIMPSVDRVGRHFPLTIAVGLEPQPQIVATVFAAQGWFTSIETLALSSLDIEFPVDELEKSLSTTPFISSCGFEDSQCKPASKFAQWWNGPGAIPLALNMPDPDPVTALLSIGALNTLSTCGFGKSLWWTRDEQGRAWQLQGFCGLPPERHFATLLAGDRWHEDESDAQGLSSALPE